MKKAIVLFSGGLDSTTCLAIAKAEGFHCYGLTFHYGQRHSVEIESAKSIGKSYDLVEHLILKLPLDQIQGSSLTNHNLEVPDYVGDHRIPNTYVPARNTIFLAFAFSWGEVIEAYDIFIGANYLDYSGYPDCRPEYMQAMENIAQQGTKAGTEGKVFKIHAPLLALNKAQIINVGIKLGVDYAKTVSCYRADHQGRACGSCDACTYRKKGFLEAAVSDPTYYF